MASILLNNIPFPDSDMDAGPNASLGQFMTAWSQVEVVCGHLMFAMAKVPFADKDPEFQAVESRDDVDRLKKKMATDAIAGPYAGLADDFRSLFDRRNRIVHAVWGKLSGEPARFWHSLSNEDYDLIGSESPDGLRLRATCIHTVADLIQLTADCTRIWRALNDVVRLVCADFWQRWRAEFQRRKALPPDPIEEARRYQEWKVYVAAEKAKMAAAAVSNGDRLPTKAT